MATSNMEWVEIIEPKTGEHMYANLTTGQCVWEPPEGVAVKRTDSNQWWELFDPNTSRFYYYNAFSSKTVWHKPTNCDIIPLAKLQRLKQNTDPEDREAKTLVNQATQTPVAKSIRHHGVKNHSSHHPHANVSGISSCSKEKQPISLSASTPQLRRRTAELSRSCSFASQRQDKQPETNNTQVAQPQHPIEPPKLTQIVQPPRPSLVSTITQQQQTSIDSTSSSANSAATSGVTPLYSNWHEALQHYILQQNSGYRRGETIDSDTGSDHSFSGSESLTGHEPDNEDSDQSDSNFIRQHRNAHLDSNKTTSSDSEYLNYTYQNRPPHEPDKYLTYAFRNNFAATTTSSSSLPVPPTTQTSHSFNSCPRVDSSSHNNQTNQAIAPLWPEEQYYSIAESTAVPASLIPPEIDMEKFAQDNLNLRSKGLFRRKVSVRDMLSWSGESINRPMLVVAGEAKQHNKMARDLFRLVQMYMGDRKPRPGQTLNAVLLEILATVFTNAALRDELYVQLCRQTTENPHKDSLINGWELFAIALAFIPPSVTFQPVLLSYLTRHYDANAINAKVFSNLDSAPPHVKISHYAHVAINRLERIGAAGKRKARKPTEDDIQAARIQIFKTSMFGNTLHEVMSLQKDRYPDRQLPWVQVVLSEQILELDGANTEGIFRVSADVDEVNTHKSKLDQWQLPEPSDAHVPANLLKLWYRELYEPLIPDSIYDECVYEPMTAERATNIVARLPRINRLVLCYLVRFLQKFSQPHVALKTKMDASNLAMVFAPNCLRCTATDPRIIFENARKEMSFMRCLIEGLDTACVKDVT